MNNLFNYLSKHRLAVVMSLIVSVFLIGSFAAARSSTVQDWFDPKGSLSITTQPDDFAAEVWVDGQSEGFTPLSIERLSEGQHTIKVVYEGYEPYFQEVDIKAKKNTEVTISLGQLENWAEYVIELQPILNSGISDQLTTSVLKHSGPDIPAEATGQIYVEHPMNLEPMLNYQTDGSTTGTMTFDIEGYEMVIAYLYPIGFGPEEPQVVGEQEVVLTNSSGDEIVRTSWTHEGSISYRYTEKINDIKVCGSGLTSCFFPNYPYPLTGVVLSVWVDLPVDLSIQKQADILATADLIAMHITADTPQSAVPVVNDWPSPDPAQQVVIDTAYQVVDFPVELTVPAGWSVRSSKGVYMNLGSDSNQQNGTLVTISKDGYELTLQVLRGQIDQNTPSSGSFLTNQQYDQATKLQIDQDEAIRLNYFNMLGAGFAVEFPESVENDGVITSTLLGHQDFVLSVDYILADFEAMEVSSQDQPYIDQMDAIVNSITFN